VKADLHCVDGEITVDMRQRQRRRSVRVRLAPPDPDMPCTTDRSVPVRLRPRSRVDRHPKEIDMLFSADTLESELSKLRGLLQMLHEDQPDVMEDVFEFHVTSLITHTAAEHHPHIRQAARDMLVAIQQQPVRAVSRTPEILLMPDTLVPAM
jgi:hypothetical protein